VQVQVCRTLCTSPTKLCLAVPQHIVPAEVQHERLVERGCAPRASGCVCGRPRLAMQSEATGAGQARRLPKCWAATCVSSASPGFSPRGVNYPMYMLRDL